MNKSGHDFFFYYWKLRCRRNNFFHPVSHNKLEVEEEGEERECGQLCHHMMILVVLDELEKAGKGSRNIELNIIFI